MTRSSLGWCLAAALPLLSSCSSAPPAQTAAREKVEKVSLVCNSSSRMAVFSQLGVPSGENPRDVAVSDRYVFVLFEPARLLRLERDGDSVKVAMKLGPPGETWKALDVDPVDGSVWITKNLGFQKISPSLQMTAVDLQKVEGEGTFLQLVVAEDAIYVQPTFSDHGVWRVDRSGNVLQTMFPVPKEQLDRLAKIGRGEASPTDPGTLMLGVRLERDAQGHVLVWDRDQRKTFEIGAEGAVTEVETPFTGVQASEASGTVSGVGVGGPDEAWYLPGLGDLFFWKGRPVFLGRAVGPGNTLYLVPDEEETRELFETCQVGSLWKVAANATRYAALTQRGVVFGDFATAPDLP